MSLYGALFGGVSGLKSQSSKIGVISDNIANVNTVGYKQAQATFETLVVNTSSAVSYQTGGARGGSRISVDKQGLILSTEVSTDIAISGNGMFVVNSKTDGSSTPLYTRAGSFRQDSLGNFVNAAGFFLQGWPLDREGRLPGEPGNLNTTSINNLDSLQTINVESASGIATATSIVEIGANLDASEEVYPGEEAVVVMDSLSGANFGIDGDTIIVPDEFGLAATNSIHRGDRFSIATGNGLNYEYEYGGFMMGRSVTTAGGTTNFGDGGVDNTALQALDVNADVVARVISGSATYFDITVPSHNLITGDQITIAGIGGAVGGTPAAQLNATHTITRVDANTIRIQVATAHALADGTSPPADAFTLDSRVFGGNIMDASSASEAFLGTVGTTGFTSDAMTFTITTATTGTVTFRYTSASPNTSSGQFNNLNTLAEAIKKVNGLTARVQSGRLVVGSEDANEAVTFANGDATGTSTKRGIDWISELDLHDVGAGSRRYSSLNGLADVINQDDGVSASVDNPNSQASLNIRVDDPLDTITIADVGSAPFTVAAADNWTVPATAAGVACSVVIDLATAVPSNLAAGDYIVIQNATAGTGGLPGGLPNTGYLDANGDVVAWQVTAVDNTLNTITFTIPGTYITAAVAGGAAIAGNSSATISVLNESNQGSLVAEFGLVDSLNSASYLTAGPQSTGALGPKYDPLGVNGDNMASGEITPQFARNIRVYDSLGSPHDLTMAYIKSDTNTWEVEVYAVPSTDVTSLYGDGIVAYGTIEFNGDGSLHSVDTLLADPISIEWTNGSSAGSVTFDWGTSGDIFGTANADSIGDTDGMTQFDSDYNVRFANQNGSGVGELVSVSIDSEGFVSASYNNGVTKTLFKVALADFTNVNGLRAYSGNVFAETRDSGTVNLREAGTNGTGEVVSAALEQSNVDLSEQLTDMIVAQRAYQANTRVITTTDQLLDRLTQI